MNEKQLPSVPARMGSLGLTKKRAGFAPHWARL